MIVLDWFAIFNVSTLLFALTLTINIHLIIQKGSLSRARRVDLVRAAAPRIDPIRPLQPRCPEQQF